MAPREDGSEDAVQYLALAHDALADLSEEVAARVGETLE